MNSFSWSWQLRTPECNKGTGMDPRHLDPIVERLNAYVQQRMDEENIPSVVLAITDSEKTLHVGTHGYADVAAQRPATDATLYETGSIGKSFTAAALLQLKDEGKVDLQAPVTNYLPWFAVQTQFEPITLHHLLTHSAGIIRGTDFAADQRYEVWALRDTNTSHPPGEHFRYSNVGYKVLGLILEAVEGMPYADIVQERILDPLEMTNTHPVIINRIRPLMAVGYTRLYDDRPSHRTDPIVPATWFQTNTADGCLASSIIDLATYLRLYLGRGTLNDQTIITDENFAAMSAPLIAMDRNDLSASYGYGIMTGTLDGRPVLGHSGGMVGYRSDMRGFPDPGVGVVAMVNGIGDPAEFTTFALRLLAAHATGNELPKVPDPRDLYHVANPAEYAGRYESGEHHIDLAAGDERLLLRIGDDEVPLECRGDDRFYVPQAEMRRFLLSFGRNDQGDVVETFHGNTWYVNERYDGPLAIDYPDEWNALTGDYRSHNPWHPHLRILLRKGRLYVDGHPEPLQQFEDGSFGHQGDPERLRFDTLVDGVALRLNYSGNDFYRFFTDGI
jgi:D-alanyl-D-alanine carboxypeptidase